MKHVLGNKKAIALFVVPGLILYVGLVFVPVIWSLYILYIQERRDLAGASAALRIIQNF